MIADIFLHQREFKSMQSTTKSQKMRVSNNLAFNFQRERERSEKYDQCFLLSPLKERNEKDNKEENTHKGDISWKIETAASAVCTSPGRSVWFLMIQY
jgi:hypothetical protein